MTPKPDPPVYEFDADIAVAYDASLHSDYGSSLTRLIAFSTHLIQRLAAKKKISPVAVGCYQVLFDNVMEDIRRKGGDNNDGVRDSKGND